jgi:glucose/arabinose dehydrogenase/mono/diheme cytochrome c family protein
VPTGGSRSAFAFISTSGAFGSVQRADTAVVNAGNSNELRADRAEIQQAGNGEMDEDELIGAGEEIYADNCATCHRLDGSGSGGYPALDGNALVTDEDPSGLIDIITHGRAQMPAFGDQLADDEIAAVASYVRTSWSNEASVVQVADVSGEQDGESAEDEQDAGQPEEAAQDEDDEQDEEQGAGEQAGGPTPIPIIIQIQIAVVTPGSGPPAAEADDAQAAPEQAEGEEAETAAEATPSPEANAGEGEAEETETPDAGEAGDADAAQDAAEATPTPAAGAGDDAEEDGAAGAGGPAAAGVAMQEEDDAAATATPTPTPAAGAGGDQSEEEQAAGDDDAAGDPEEPAEELDEEEAEAEQEAAGEDQSVAGQEVPQSVVQPNGTLPGDPAIQLVKVADGLIDPINVTSAPDGSGRVFIVERIGRVLIVEDGELLEEPFLDISDNMKIDFLEQGLLGLAFHPEYADNGRFFVYYTDWRTNGDSVLAEFRVSDDDPNRADPNSARVLLTADQPFINHNGGNLIFGPDGYLYLALGDGGMAGDPYRNAQKLDTLLGSILRLDIDTDSPQGYTIPEDNPFAGRVLYSSMANNQAQDGSYVPNARPEIWVYGLRNPWQFSFDRETGDVYIADVGQAGWEEINFLAAGEQGGQNFGWPELEGSHCYLDEECGRLGVLPVAEYANPDEGCSITGIGVYRGEEFSSLDGIYFAADWCSGRIWGLMQDEGGEWQFAELLDTDLLITGAGEGEEGDLYVTVCNCQFGRNYDPFANPGGTLWRIVAADQVPDGAETATADTE